MSSVFWDGSVTLLDLLYAVSPSELICMCGILKIEHFHCQQGNLVLVFSPYHSPSLTSVLTC